MKRLLATGLALAAATPALAHHPLGGAPMTTFAEGALSGVGHPVLGFDHLFFVALVGVAASLTAQRLAAPAAYVAAMLLGTLMMSAGVGLPAKEIVIVLSLLTLGGLLAAGRALSLPVTLALFAGFGLFHGSAFGDSIAGQEGGIGGAVLLGYLLGLGVTQYLIALGAGYAARVFFAATEPQATSARIAGALVAGAGLLLTFETLEGAAFAALGWG